MKSKSIVAICPGNSVTGGPELIHQLVDNINENGGDARVLYYPFNKSFQVPTAYTKYNIKVCRLSDLKDRSQDIVVPEIATPYIRQLPESKIHIWWLSIDNYFKFKQSNSLSICKVFIKRIINHPSLPISFSQLSSYKHWVQSYYAKQFLKSKSIESELLSDFLNEEHMNQKIDINKKKNIICFNPKKGGDVTSRIIESYPQYEYVPIQNMTAQQVSELLHSSKIYIDFGNHPGKDRIPREAAMAGCVVITGTKGSAKNKYDIEVDSKYKIDENEDDFMNKVGLMFDTVISDFEVHFMHFEFYRNKISKEKSVFDKQVLNFIDSL